MFNPHIESRLVETPSPAAESDAPKAGVVLVVGTAGAGPTTPVVFENGEDPYVVYGREGTLAEKIEAAVFGAEYGARVAGSGAVPRVVGLRVATGTKASAVLFADAGQTEKVMTIETADPSEAGNGFRVRVTAKTITISDPETGRETTFHIDRDAAGAFGAARTPLELAEAIRRAFDGRLHVTTETARAHWEIVLDETESVVTSTDKKTEINLSGLSVAEMHARSAGSETYVDHTEPYDFSAEGARAVHNRPITAALNRDARFYAVTAGAPVELAKDTLQVQVPHLADAKTIGLGETGTLLNLRTTGETAGAPVTLAEAASAPGVALPVSEGYWRVRNHFVGNFNPNATAQTVFAVATHTVRAATAADVDLTTPAEALTIDGVALVAGDRVLVKNQAAPAENGVYVVVDAGEGDVALARAAGADTPADFAAQVVAVTSGTASGGKYFRMSGGGAFIVDTSPVVYTEVAPEDAYTITFSAPEGVADEGGHLAAAYALTLGGGYTAAAVSTARLGTHFHYVHPALRTLQLARGHFRLDVQPAASGAPEPLQLNLDCKPGGGIFARLTWSAGKATVYLHKGHTDAYHPGGRLDDGFLFASYDSCLFTLGEKASPALLSDSQSGYEFAATGDTLTFSRRLEHALVVRGLRITHYRLGSDLVVRRTGGGNVFTLSGEGKQPGEAGRAIGKMQVIFGADYAFEPEWPAVGTYAFSGGSSGANAGVRETLAAAERALAENRDLAYRILVLAGLYADDTVEGVDTQTGVRRRVPAGVLDAVARHQQQVDRVGAAGVAYLSVRPMTPSQQSGFFTDAQKRQRFAELVQTDVHDATRLATILSGRSLPSVFLFDAPMRLTLSGRTITTDGAAFLAGLRSALTNDVALYQVQLPANVVPLYRYDAADVHMPSLLAQARVNTWTERRGDPSLADERTAAGLVPDARGRLVPSGFQSGVALLSANDFRQAAAAALRTLLGPLHTTGPDSLRHTVKTLLDGVANRISGVRGVQINPNTDIKINALGGNAYGLLVKCRIHVAGEIRLISLEVGETADLTTTPAAQSATLPLAQ